MKKRSHQSHNYKELNSANNLNEPGSEFFPRASRKECSLATTFISALSKDHEQRASHIMPGLLTQSCGLINGYCFKPRCHGDLLCSNIRLIQYTKSEMTIERVERHPVKNYLVSIHILCLITCMFAPLGVGVRNLRRSL